jgi:pimeloyl-ACP methyl ester carboxylesterase
MLLTQRVIVCPPGNPGLVDFYIPFLSGVYSRYPSSNFAIVAHGHLGHCPHLQANHQPEESLNIQVQTSLEVLDAISALYAKTRIVVVGHSVGAWLALQVPLPLL